MAMTSLITKKFSTNWLIGLNAKQMVQLPPANVLFPFLSKIARFFVLLPSKVTSFKDSIFPKGVILLQIIKKQESSPALDLYLKTKNSFDSIDSFISTLDFLFVIGLISLDSQHGRIVYAG